MKKVLLTPLLIILMMASFSTIALAEENITLTINDTSIVSATESVQENGNILVPVRIIAENLGAAVDYQDESQSVTITRNDQTIILILNETIAVVNGETQNLLIPPKIINGTTMVPIRFISENLGCDVKWDSETKNVTINNPVQIVNEEQSLVIQNATLTDALSFQSDAEIKPTVSSNSNNAASADVVVYKTKTGDKYHFDGCRSLKRSKIEITIEQAVQIGLTPCSICNPPVLK